MEKSQKIELLAPAGDMESFKAALANGANAIYLGLNNFNARGNIQNFTQDNLSQVVRTAHLYGVKIYLTLNTLVKDEEIKEVLKLVRNAIGAKVDAFIVQDVGLLHLLSHTFKNIELHASTQMGLSNLEGVKFIESLGVKRVVLARETPLCEISRINNNSNLEIEYFIQGALCVGFSGNCYLCSLLAGASGNRGKCKQFCRLEYNINGGKNGYYLSTKDFCMLPKLKEMAQCGVTSFKIEGRARRAAYVAVAVDTYRKAIDNNFEYAENDIENLKKVFNRGDFISGYFDGDKIIYSQKQNHIGVPIGKVISFKKGKRFNEVIISSKHKLTRGDTLKLFENGKETITISPVDIKPLKDDKYLFTTTSALKIGWQVNIIVDKSLEENSLKKVKLIDFDAKFQGKTGEKAKLILTSGKNQVEIESDEALSEANSQPLSKEDIVSTLLKSEEFSLKNIELHLDKVFMRKSQLNELRRKAFDSLREKIISANEKNEPVEVDFNLNSTILAPKNNKKIVFCSDLHYLLNEEFLEDYYVYSPNNFVREEIIKLGLSKNSGKIYLNLPVIATKEDIDFLREIIKQSGLGIYATNYYAFSLTSPEKVIVGSEMNVYNSYAIDFYLSKGYKKIVLSKEDFETETLKSDDCQLFVDKRPPRLIYFKHCPIKEHIGGNCGNCKFSEANVYNLGRTGFELKREKVKTCSFYLKGRNPLIKESRFGSVIEI